MLDTILSALLPMVFTPSCSVSWPPGDAISGQRMPRTLNRMVLLYAVPMALFAGTVTTSRAALSRDIPLVIALCVGIIGLYGAGLSALRGWLSTCRSAPACWLL